MADSIKTKYGHEQLMSDIVDLNEITHPYSILAIKNIFDQHPNQFLQYFDNKWDCWFFPNYSTKSSDDENKEYITSKLSNELKVNKNSISIDLCGEATHEKLSPSDNQRKCYYHKLYSVSISDNENIRTKEFEIDGVLYRWMSPEEMRNNDKIKEKNLDVVEFVLKTIA